MATPTGTEARVCADIARRQQHGLAKYGRTVENNPLSWREWAKHHYQELLDAATYVRRTIEQHDADVGRTTDDLWR